MSDLFHEDIPVSFIQEVFDTMGQADWHTFQILTKRDERLAEIAGELDWHPNVWMGLTIENRRWARKRGVSGCGRRSSSSNRENQLGQ